jgi:D-sedoheptulose 7-phosphate isomerase
VTDTSGSRDALAIEHVATLFEASIAAKRRSGPLLAGPVVRAARMMHERLSRGGKILCCGNGGSAADAQHFAAELLNRFECERPALAAIALSTDTSTLTSVANDRDFTQVFARQLEALAHPGDVLLAITTSGNSPNVEAAIRIACTRGASVVLLTGRDGGRARGLLREHDVELCVAHDSTARIQEVHILLLHCLCSLLDQWVEGRDAR